MHAGAASASTWVNYFQGWLNPATAATNGGYSYKIYNEIYEGGSGATGIYEKKPNGTKVWALNGLGYVYLSHSATYDVAYCWNREASGALLVDCNFVKQ